MLTLVVDFFLMAFFTLVFDLDLETLDLEPFLDFEADLTFLLVEAFLALVFLVTDFFLLTALDFVVVFFLILLDLDLLAVLGILELFWSVFFPFGCFLLQF